MKKPAKTNTIPEQAISRLAKRGLLATAGRKALQASLHQGLSVLVMQQGNIYRLHPDGSKILVKSALQRKVASDLGKTRRA